MAKPAPEQNILPPSSRRRSPCRIMRSPLSGGSVTHNAKSSPACTSAIACARWSRRAKAGDQMPRVDMRFDQSADGKIAATELRQGLCQKICAGALPDRAPRSAMGWRGSRLAARLPVRLSGNAASASPLVASCCIQGTRSATRAASSGRRRAARTFMVFCYRDRTRGRTRRHARANGGHDRSGVAIR